jgi:hypothetical protein
MSLQLAAQHLADHGRGKDTELVHMDKGEVRSLQALAQQHGGHLTINPHTGLVEAGFLSSILPMVAGAALGPAGFGITSALGAGLMVGAGSMILNPKGGLMGGLMAGLGAYGGAGLGEGLAKLGVSSEAGLTGGATANEAVDEQMKKMVADRETQIAEQQANLTKMDPSYNPTSGGQITNTPMQPYTDAELAQNRATLMNEYQATAPKTAPQSLSSMAPTDRFNAMMTGAQQVVSNPSQLKDVGGGSYAGLAKLGAEALAPAAPAVASSLAKPGTLNIPGITTATGASGQAVVPRYSYTPGMATPTPVASATGRENLYFPGSKYTALSADEASSLYGYPIKYGYADGGATVGRNPVEQMSNQNAIGANTGFPQAYLHNNAYATPYQTPVSQNVLTGPGDTGVDPYTGEQKMATGGISDARYNLGGYSDGGRLLRGPGDGVSDSIPAVIGKKQPARLADGEFVVPARIVSELGNGSTEAGARKLYAMMDRIQASRKKTVGKDRVAYNNKVDRHLPA